MDETITITIEFSQTAAIHASTVCSQTCATTGIIFLPFPWSAFNPIAVLASLLIFLSIGVAMKKPTSFILAWVGLTLTGIFSQDGIYWYFTAILLITLFMLYHLFRLQKWIG